MECIDFTLCQKYWKDTFLIKIYSKNQIDTLDRSKVNTEVFKSMKNEGF